MAIFSKKALMGLCLLLSMGYHTYAVEVGIGAKIGADLTFSKVIVIADQVSYTERITRPYGAALSIGLFSDIWLLNWLALTPSFTASLFRNSMDRRVDSGSDGNPTYTIKTVNHAFDLDLLAKFKVHWWYGAIGAGLTFATKPTFSLEGFSDLIKPTNHLGVNIILETGLYIPLDKEAHHNLLVGLRGAMDVLSFNLKPFAQLEALERGEEGLTGTHPSRAVVGLSLGYVYKF